MIYFHCFAFSELSLDQLYSVLQLRSEIFVVEQKCLYLDPDGKDETALHLLGIEDNQLLAYLRFFPPSSTQSSLVFGRVLSAPSARGKGYGKQLIQTFLNYCASHFPGVSIECSAQYYLKRFYEEFGFKVSGEVYLEDDIPHIAMHK